MKNLKKILAGTMSVLMAFGAAACGNGSSSSSAEESFEPQVEVNVDANTIEAIPDGAEKKLVWMSYFDLNPSKTSPEKSTALTLFESKGGSIEYSRVTSLNKYEKLAAAIMSKQVPDIFWYEQGMTFPYNVIMGMFQPVDDIVNFDDPLWSGVKGTADQFVLNDKHYVAPINMLPLSVMCYDKSLLAKANLDDPYELYENGEWTWDAWYEMMEEYCANSTEEEPLYGVNGWFAPFFYHSTGSTLVQYDAEKGEYYNNLNDPNLERAANFLSNVKKNGYYDPEWIGGAPECFQKNILFYAMGPWASIDSHTPKEGQEWGMVPIPRDPNTDTLYTSIDVNAYMWVKGSTKKEAVKCWQECARIAFVDDQYIQTEREKFDVSNPNWTDEMYNVAYVDLISDKYTQVFDPGYGISTKLSDNDAATNDTKEAYVALTYRGVLTEDEDGNQLTWTQIRESYSNIFDTEIADFNKKLKDFVAQDS